MHDPPVCYKQEHEKCSRTEENDIYGSPRQSSKARIALVPRRLASISTPTTYQTEAIPNKNAAVSIPRSALMQASEFATEQSGCMCLSDSNHTRFRSRFAGALIEYATCQGTGVQFRAGGMYPMPSRITAIARLTAGSITLSFPLIFIPSPTAYCRILGFATEYSTSVRKFTATYVNPMARMQPCTRK